MPVFKSEFYPWIPNIADGGMGLMGLMGFALIFCYGYWCICKFMVVAVGVAVVVVGMVHCGFTVGMGSL